MNRISRLLHAILRIYKHEGLGGVLRRVKKRLTETPPTAQPNTGLFRKRDLIGFYDFVLSKKVESLSTEESALVSPLSVNWIIPDFGIGSGGHLNIFRFIAQLEKRGYKNVICIVGDHRHASALSAKALINKHFFELNAEVVIGLENLPAAEFSFATSWITAYSLRSFSKTSHKLYFVQDFEPAFYAAGSEYDFSERTYKLGFKGVTAGSWLSGKLISDYKMSSESIGFSYEKNLYRPLPRRDPETKRVFCYCRPPTIRRGLETSMLALNLVGEALPQTKFIFAGWDMSEYYFPHEHLNAGVLSLAELPDLYSQCDVALVLSFTNLSLLPLELMACRCAVVSNEGPNTEWLLNKDNASLSSGDPAELAQSIIHLLENDAARIAQLDRAQQFAAQTSWEAEGDKLIRILERVRVEERAKQ